MEKKYLRNRIVTAVGVLVVVALIAVVGFILAGALQDAREGSIEGLHDVRSERPKADAREALGGSVEFYYLIYSDPDCPACEKYMPQAIDAGVQLNNEFGDSFGMVIIIVGGHSDEDVLAYIDKHHIPLTIPVLNGASEEQTGLPAEVKTKSNAVMNPRGVPATFVYFKAIDTEEWWTMGSFAGVFPAENLISLAKDYFAAAAQY